MELHLPEQVQGRILTRTRYVVTFCKSSVTQPDPGEFFSGPRVVFNPVRTGRHLQVKTLFPDFSENLPGIRDGQFAIFFQFDGHDFFRSAK